MARKWSAISIQAEPEYIQAIKAVAQEEGTSVGVIVRACIDASGWAGKIERYMSASFFASSDAQKHQCSDDA